MSPKILAVKDGDLGTNKRNALKLMVFQKQIKISVNAYAKK
jgi:hypothetical protein